MDITSPLVTVYITNYNYGKYVKKAIESVLSQTFTDFELIVIDDGSTDKSREIIRAYEGHSKVRIIFQENKGLNRTSNIALRAARGKYIMRLDADDFLDHNALLVMTKIMESKADLGLVFPDYYYIDEEDQILGQEKRHDFEHSVTLQDQPAHGACTLIRKRALIGIGGYCEDYRCQDGYDLWLRLIEKHEVRNVNLPLFYHRRHGNNLTDNNELILETRAEIKRTHAERSNKPPLHTLGILPVRGKKVYSGCLALENLGDKLLIDWTIEAALEAKGLKSLIVSSPDEDILSHVKQSYGGEIITHVRPLEMARENVPLEVTVEHILTACANSFEVQGLMMLFIEAPFRSAMYIDKAINTMRIFEVDSVVGVVPENDLFFRHSGHGLELVGNTDFNDGLRFERDYIYRKVYGMHLVSFHFYQQEKKCLGGRIGHVTFDPIDTVTVTNAMELEIANFILQKKTR